MEFDLRAFRTKTKESVKQEHDNPISIPVGIGIFSGMALIGTSIGATIGTYVFFGTVALVGLAAIIESQPRLKKLATRSNKLIDVMIFIGSVYATATVGITAAAALTFAGVGYTLVYGPWLRREV